MKAVPHTFANIPVVVLSHETPQGPLEIQFNISVFRRESFHHEGKDKRVFDYINAYWASLPKEEQDEIFNIYLDIYHAFGDIHVKHNLNDYLKKKINELMQYHKLEKLEYWTQVKSDIRVPEDVKSTYVHSIDSGNTREKSYIKSDYIKLVTMSLAFRAILPIWGEYIFSNRKDVGTKLKEFYALQLIQESELWSCEAMKKLEVYIQHNTNSEKTGQANALDGISSEDSLLWLLSLICILKLSVVDISGHVGSTNLMIVIFGYIKQKSDNKGFGEHGNFQVKRDDDGGGDDDNSKSTLERYKIKIDTSIGEIVELEYSMRDIFKIAGRLTSQIPEGLLERSLRTSKELENHPILIPQITLLRWVFKPVISPTGIMYLPKHTIIEALGCLESVLWARGHKYLALLATSHAVFMDDAMVISPMDSKMRVPQELSEELNKYYPYTRSVPVRRGEREELNLAADSIDKLTNKLSMFSWKPTASDDMLKEVLGNQTRYFPIKPDIKTDLTKLVIDLAKRDFF